MGYKRDIELIEKYIKREEEDIAEGLIWIEARIEEITVIFSGDKGTVYKVQVGKKEYNTKPALVGKGELERAWSEWITLAIDEKGKLRKIKPGKFNAEKWREK